MGGRVGIDLTGREFGNWMVLRLINRGRYKRYLCRCRCGTEKPVTANSLYYGRSRSCGCARDRATGDRSRTHGETRMVSGKSVRTPEYQSWCHMINRAVTAKPGSRPYRYYRARGITVCERWLKFENFLEDMGRKPGPKYSIEREDNDGNYEPDNCFWATKKQQLRNTRRTNLIEFRGEKQCLSDWARSIGIANATLRYRIKRWGLESALLTMRRPDRTI